MNNLSRTGLNRILPRQPNNYHLFFPQTKRLAKLNLYKQSSSINQVNQRQFSTSSKPEPTHFQLNKNDFSDDGHQLYVPSSDLKKKMEFRGGKLLIFKMEQFDAHHLISLRLIMALNGLTLYNFGTSVAKFRIIRSCFWGGLSAFISRTAYRWNNMFAATIKMIHLCDDGRHVEITFLDDSTARAEIRQISRLSDGVEPDNEDSTHVHSVDRVRAFRQHQDRFQDQAEAYMPILIGDQLYALDLDCSVPHREILNAITRGLPIKTDLMEENMLNDGTEEDKEAEKRTWVDITNIQRKQEV